MRPLRLALLLAMIATSCGQATWGRAASADSGIEGTTVIGPICPNQPSTGSCANQPVAAGLVIRDKAGAVAIRYRTGPDGRFRLGLPAGRYTIEGDGTGNPGATRPRTVSVPSDHYVSLGEIVFDAGIR
jgi:hypothetical protein